MTSERPEAVERLDLHLAAVRLAHEAIWDLHDADRAGALRRGGEVGDGARRTDGGDRDSRALGEARRLRILWDGQGLLDPPAADETARRLKAEVDRAEPERRRLRELQNQIARRLFDSDEEEDEFFDRAPAPAERLGWRHPDQ